MRPLSVKSLPTRWPGLSGDRVFYYIIVTLAIFLVMIPLLMLVYSSFRTGRPGLPGGEYTLQNYLTAYTNKKSYEAILNSFGYAGGGTLISVIIAIIMSWAIERTNMPLRNLSYALLLVPLAIPGMLFSISWILLLSPDIGFLNILIRKALGIFGIKLSTGPFNIYTLYGMFFLEGLRHVPTIFLMISAAFRNMDPALEEAAFVSGCGTVRTLRQVTIPVLFPAILGAFIYSFMTGIESFEIPGIIGLPANIYVFSTRIYWAS
ncbi:MAG: ABC transporter permease subunit, partial [Firmicutes bacterium]|nr:ABC transporter permease subunit [Bacillota bacterium]